MPGAIFPIRNPYLYGIICNRCTMGQSEKSWASSHNNYEATISLIYGFMLRWWRPSSLSTTKRFSVEGAAGGRSNWREWGLDLARKRPPYCSLVGPCVSKLAPASGPNQCTAGPAAAPTLPIRVPHLWLRAARMASIVSLKEAKCGYVGCRLVNPVWASVMCVYRLTYLDLAYLRKVSHCIHLFRIE